MWNFATNCIASSIGLRNNIPKPNRDSKDCSDDEASSTNSRDEGLECPICWESFNIVENIPYVLWCGHTLCKNCILGLHWAVVKFPTLPIQMPLFISCPWCNLLSFRLVYRGNLKFPRKNFFLLWMLESMNGDRLKSHSESCNDHHHHHQPTWPSNNNNTNQWRGQFANTHSETSLTNINENRSISNSVERVHSCLRKSLVMFVHMTAKFPLVIIFLLIIVYVIPASAVILGFYMLVTLLFAVPSFVILYFAYPTLDWLVREIVT